MLSLISMFIEFGIQLFFII